MITLRHVRASLSVARAGVIQLLDQARSWVAFVLSMLIVCVSASNWVVVYRESGYPVQLAEPFVSWMSIRFSGLLVFGLLLIILCDAPFYSRYDSWLLIRGGRKSWYMGKCLQIFAISALYVLLMATVSLLFALPMGYVDNRWSLAAQWLSAPAQQTIYLQRMWTSDIPFAFFQAAYPWQVFCGGIILYILYACGLSFVAMIGNILFPRWAGTALAGGFHILFYALTQSGSGFWQNVSPLQYLGLRSIFWDHPWGFGSFPGVVLIFLGVNIGLIFLGGRLLKRFDLEREHI